MPFLAFAKKKMFQMLKKALRAPKSRRVLHKDSYLYTETLMLCYPPLQPSDLGPDFAVVDNRPPSFVHGFP